MPKLTVLVSSYNRHVRLELAVRSVLAQTHRDLEVFIMDDGSPRPEIAELLDRLTQEDGRVSAIQVRQRWDKAKVCTFGALLNLGQLVTDSEYLSFLCDSAEYLPERCERLIAHLDRERDCHLAWDRQHHFRLNRDGHTTSQRIAEEQPEFVAQHQGQQWFDWLKQANQVDHNSVVERRTASPAHWSEDVGDWYILDWERWLRLARKGRRFDELGWVGEVKRCQDGDSTGELVGSGKTIAEVIAIRSAGGVP